jgi:hypothetical protein
VRHRTVENREGPDTDPRPAVSAWPRQITNFQGTPTMTSRETYIDKMKVQLDELDAKMDTLQAKAHEAKLEARDTYRQEMDKLRQQSVLAKGKLVEMKTASEDAWGNMVTEMEKIRDAFKHSFSYFKSQI